MYTLWLWKVEEMSDCKCSKKDSDSETTTNLNWLTTQNRHLVGRVQQLESILNAVQKQSPEALSFLQETQTSQEI